MMRGLCRQTGLLAQGRGLVRSFPREVGVRTAEMPVGRSLPVNRTPQIQRLDNALRGQLEIGAHQIGNLAFVNLRGAKSIDQYANRLSYANGVGKLHFTAIGQSGGNDVLGDVARHVAGRAVNLGRVFAAECTTAVTSHATVGVHDDLAAGQSGVTHGATDYEAARWIDVILGVLVEHLLGQRGLDHILQDVSAQLFGRNRLRVLAGDDHRINANRLV